MAARASLELTLLAPPHTQRIAAPHLPLVSSAMLRPILLAALAAVGRGCADTGNPPGCQVECSADGDNPQCGEAVCNIAGGDGSSMWCEPGGGCNCPDPDPDEVCGGEKAVAPSSTCTVIDPTIASTICAAISEWARGCPKTCNTCSPSAPPPAPPPSASPSPPPPSASPSPPPPSPSPSPPPPTPPPPSPSPSPPPPSPAPSPPPPIPPGRAIKAGKIEVEVSQGQGQG